MSFTTRLGCALLTLLAACAAGIETHKRAGFERKLDRVVVVLDERYASQRSIAQLQARLGNGFERRGVTVKQAPPISSALSLNSPPDLSQEILSFGASTVLVMRLSAVTPGGAQAGRYQARLFDVATGKLVWWAEVPGSILADAAQVESLLDALGKDGLVGPPTGPLPSSAVAAAAEPGEAAPRALEGKRVGYDRPVVRLLGFQDARFAVGWPDGFEARLGQALSHHRVPLQLIPLKPALDASAVHDLGARARAFQATHVLVVRLRSPVIADMHRLEGGWYEAQLLDVATDEVVWRRSYSIDLYAGDKAPERLVEDLAADGLLHDP